MGDVETRKLANMLRETIAASGVSGEDVGFALARVLYEQPCGHVDEFGTEGDFRRYGCSRLWHNDLRHRYVEAEPPTDRATGGIMAPGKWYTVGEPGCSLPRTDTVRFGDHEIRVVEHPSIPADLLVAIGSCSCGHPVGDHGPVRCAAQPCQCETPVSRLITSVKIVPEGTES